MFGKTRLSVPKTTWAYIAILSVLVVGAIMREINLLIILAGMMCGPLLISWQMVRTNLKQLRVQRRLPRGVHWGSPFDVKFTLMNQRKHVDSWAVVLEDRVRNLTFTSTQHEQGRCFVPHIPLGETRTATYPARLHRRGRYRFGPLRIGSRVPVGLLRGRATAKNVDEMLVYPRLGYLLRGWKNLVRLDEQGQRSTHRRLGRSEGDFFGLRDWQIGDCRRWIHWRSSAKRNDLVVRQFEQQRNQDLVLLLDLTHLSVENNAASPRQETDTDTDADASAVELAVSFTATAVTEHCRRGAGQLTLRVAGNPPREVRGPAGSTVLHDALEVLAECMPADNSETPCEQLGPLLDLRRDDHVVIVCPGAVDPTRWWESNQTAPTAFANPILIDTTSSRFHQLFAWDEPNPVGRQSDPARESSPSKRGSEAVGREATNRRRHPSRLDERSSS